MARLKCSAEADEVAKHPHVPVAEEFRQQESAEKEAKRCDHDLWPGNLIICFGRYAGQTYKWLLEEDVGWVVWLLSRFILTEEKCPELKWQKERLLEYAGDFFIIMELVNKRFEDQRKDTRTPTPNPDFKPEAEYADDVELLSLAGELVF